MKAKVKLSVTLSFLFFSLQSQVQETIYLCGNSNMNGWIDVWKYTYTSSTSGGFSKLTNNYYFQYWWVEPSPDNSKLLLMRTPIGPGISPIFNYDSCQVVILDLASNMQTVIVDYDQFGWHSFGNAHWHPSVNRIIIYAKTGNNSFLYTINTDGSNPQQISNQYSLDPNWSKSGDRITFIGHSNSRTLPLSYDDYEVYTADYDYQSNTISNVSQLTNDTLRDINPCFSPDDTQIVFSSGDDSLTYSDLIVIDINGANRLSLVNDGSTNIGPLNWGTNNKIYYHNKNLTANPYRAKVYDVFGNINASLFPPSSSGGISISPYYKNLSLLATNVLEVGLSSVLVYPNPTHDFLTIELSSFKNMGAITISNLEGKIVLESTISEVITNLDITDLSNGVYILQLKFDNQIINRKISKSW